MNNATLPQWLERLEQLHPDVMDLGLERVGAVANRLELLPLAPPVITVAGTNGKGSTLAVMEALAGQAGYVTGLSTSPHFLRFNERIRVAGQDVDDATIIQAFEAIEAARGETSLTYFEFSTLAALWVFRARCVDMVLLEVGLGGRLDAVNIVDPTIAVITSIDLDHQEWLGATRDLIAREKAGILRAGIDAVIGDPAPPSQLLDCVSASGARGYYIGQSFEVCDGQLRLTTSGGEAITLRMPESGGLLLQNVAAAVQALLLLDLKFDDEQLTQALQGLHLTGRREIQQWQGREYLLDVAHNPAAIDKLVEYIDITPCKKRTIALFSAMKDKPVRDMLRRCEGRFDAWFLADQARNPRAAAAADIAAMLHDEGQGMISVSKNLTQAYRRAQSLMSPGDRLVVFGSFFTVAAILPLLQKDRSKG